MKDLLDFIERLQQKSEAQRKIIAVFVVAGLTIIILGLWLATVSLVQPEPIAIPSTHEPSPLSLLWNFIKALAEQIYQ